MAVHIDLWIQWPGDRRAVRDFFFDASKCDRYWISLHETGHGRPDQLERDHYSVMNDYNIIDLNDRRFPEWEWPELPTNIHVWFTLNDSARAEQWLDESLVASVLWLASHPGDLLLSALEIPILARNAGDLIVNSEAEGRLARFALNDERAADAMKLVIETLRANGASYRRAQLPAI